MVISSPTRPGRQPLHAGREVAEHRLLREAQAVAQQPGQRALVAAGGVRWVSWNRAQSVGIPNNLTAAVNSVEHLLGSAALARHGKRVALVCGDQAAQLRRARRRGGARVGRAAPAGRGARRARAAADARHAGIRRRLAGRSARRRGRDRAQYQAFRGGVPARTQPTAARAWRSSRTCSPGRAPDLATEEAGEGSLTIAGASAGPALSWRAALARAAPSAFGAPGATRRTPRSGCIPRAPRASPRASFTRTAACCRSGRRSARWSGSPPASAASPLPSFSSPTRSSTACSDRSPPAPPRSWSPTGRTSRRVLARVAQHTAARVLQRADLLPQSARARRRSAWRRSATCAASSPPASGCRRRSSSSGARRPVGKSSRSTACPRRSAPAW